MRPVSAILKLMTLAALAGLPAGVLAQSSSWRGQADSTDPVWAANENDQFALPIHQSPAFTRPLSPPDRRVRRAETFNDDFWAEPAVIQQASASLEVEMLPVPAVRQSEPYFLPAPSPRPLPSVVNTVSSDLSQTTIHDIPVLRPVEFTEPVVSQPTRTPSSHQPPSLFPEPIPRPSMTPGTDPLWQKTRPAGERSQPQPVLPPIRTPEVQSQGSPDRVVVPPGPSADDANSLQPFVAPSSSHAPPPAMVEQPLGRDFGANNDIPAAPGDLQQIAPLAIDPFQNTASYSAGSDLYAGDVASSRGYSRPFDPFAYPEPSGEFLPNASMGVRLGNRRVVGSGGFFIPLIQDPDSVLFLDLQGRFDDHDSGDGSFGLGYRQYLNPEVVIGANIYYDLRATRSGNEFNQLGLGFELLHADWEIRLNSYLPESSDKRAASTSGVSNGSIITQNSRERAYKGIDWEIGNRWLAWGWNDRYEVRAFFGTYHFDHSSRQSRNFGGPKSRVELRVHDFAFLGAQSRIDVGMELSRDRFRHEQVFGFMRVNIPLGGADREKSVLDPLRRQLTNSPTRMLY